MLENLIVLASETTAQNASLNPGAIVMAIFGIVFLFGGSAIALRIAMKKGGY